MGVAAIDQARKLVAERKNSEEAQSALKQLLDESPRNAEGELSFESPDCFGGRLRGPTTILALGVSGHR
jgi:hypothetical protein